MAPKRRSVASARATRAHQAWVGQESRGVLIRVNATGLKALRQLALDRDTTLQALGIEAFNDLLRKHGSRPVVANPLAD